MNVFLPRVPAYSRRFRKSLLNKWSPHTSWNKKSTGPCTSWGVKTPCQKCMFRQQEHTWGRRIWKYTEIVPGGSAPIWQKQAYCFFSGSSFSYHQLLKQISQQCAVMQNTCDLQELERELSSLKRPMRGSKSKRCGGRYGKRTSLRRIAYEISASKNKSTYKTTEQMLIVFSQLVLCLRCSTYFRKLSSKQESSDGSQKLNSDGTLTLNFTFAQMRIKMTFYK